MIPTHGNYTGYYKKRAALRLDRFPHFVLSNKIVLDVGANDGHVTTAIAQSFGPRAITGVDIDNSLVDAAWRHRLAVWSQASPDGVPSYFPTSLAHELGPLPVPPADAAGHDKHVFPHNLAFHCADWTKDNIPEDEAGYDTVLALSVTKWIHLNQGDAGLVAFFRKIHRVLHDGGHLILEPQAWESYAKAKRMSEDLKANYQILELMPSDFPGALRDIGFDFDQCLGETGEGGFRRPVDLYVKRTSISTK
ncbi:Bin3-domain-containing protein [Macrolepiota fuliginosa MF-IS2]|uniref:RNA methyltransferase n=1 Tax=Macrolepiota fuliginosa MF-IS2 TaxID=1400762 RepID=A0A9P5X2E8_9AGAR|nr:Bin3-domain-containing protein [Macrolepiota fuliginosa MF-IS2]